MLNKEMVVEMAEQYAEEVSKILNPKNIIAIVLYGSYAKGTASSNSDIDIAVIVDDLTGDYLEISKQLYKIRRNISVNIEPILLISSSDKSGFISEVLKTGIIIYQNQTLKWLNTLKGNQPPALNISSKVADLIFPAAIIYASFNKLLIAYFSSSSVYLSKILS